MTPLAFKVFVQYSVVFVRIISAIALRSSTLCLRLASRVAHSGFPIHSSWPSALHSLPHNRELAAQIVM